MTKKRDPRARSRHPRRRAPLLESLEGRALLSHLMEAPKGLDHWYPGGGIYRNVWLTKTAPVHVGQWGVLVVDRDAGYHAAPCPVQYCYAPLLRALQAVGEEFATDTEVQTYVQAMQGLLAEAMRLRQRPLNDLQYCVEAARLQAAIQACSTQEARHAAVRTWQDFFVEQAARLYHWVQDRAIPADNNYAEREIRPTVLARKVSFGSQSVAGAKMRETWMSVLYSLRKREAHPAEKLVEVLNRKAQDPDLDGAAALFDLDTG